MEAKAHLVGIHERVRSDVEGSTPSIASNQGGTSTKDGGPPPRYASFCHGSIYTKCSGTIILRGACICDLFD